MRTNELIAPAAVDSLDPESVTALALSEGYDDADAYAVAFAEALCATGMDTQRERLAALATTAHGVHADAASAAEIGRHYVILDALFRRLLVDAAAALGKPGIANSAAAERLLNAAFKAQRASLACLSALKVIRDAIPDNGGRPVGVPDLTQAN